MAVIKQYRSPQWIEGSYHRLLKVEVEVDNQQIRLVTGVYPSEEARRAGAPHFWTEYSTIPFQALEGDVRSVFYPMLEQVYFSYLKDGQSDCGEEHTPVSVKDLFKEDPTTPDTEDPTPEEGA